MANMDNADQPVADAQDQPVQPPVVVHGAFGTITWTMSESVQDDLRRLVADGEAMREDYIEFAVAALIEQGSMIAEVLNVVANPLGLLIVRVFGSDAVDPFDLGSGFTATPNSVLNDILNGRAPRF